MQTIDQLLDAVKARHSIQSDYKLAQFLGLTDGAIRNYRHKRSMPDELACVRIAEALDIDGDVLAAQVQAQRARDEETRAFWHRVASRLQGGTVHGLVLACLVALGFITTPPNAVAAVTELKPANSSGLYIMFSYLRRRLRAFLRTTRGQVIGKLAGPQQHRETHVPCAWPAAPAFAVA